MSSKKKVTVGTKIRLFRHFSERLALRYEILITFEEYINLCSLPLEEPKLKNPERPVREGYLMIHGKKVRVIKNALSHRLLITALPLPKNINQNNEI